MAKIDSRRDIPGWPTLIMTLFCLCAAVLSWFLCDVDKFAGSKWLWLSFLVFFGVWIHFRRAGRQIYAAAVRDKNVTLCFLMIVLVSLATGIACKLWLPARFYDTLQFLKSSAVDSKHWIDHRVAFACVAFALTFNLLVTGTFIWWYRPDAAQRALRRSASTLLVAAPILAFLMWFSAFHKPVSIALFQMAPNSPDIKQIYVDNGYGYSRYEQIEAAGKGVVYRALPFFPSIAKFIPQSGQEKATIITLPLSLKHTAGEPIETAAGIVCYLFGPEQISALQLSSGSQTLSIPAAELPLSGTLMLIKTPNGGVLAGSGATYTVLDGDFFFDQIRSFATKEPIGVVVMFTADRTVSHLSYAEPITSGGETFYRAKANLGDFPKAWFYLPYLPFQIAWALILSALLQYGVHLLRTHGANGVGHGLKRFLLHPASIFFSILMLIYFILWLPIRPGFWGTDDCFAYAYKGHFTHWYTIYYLGLIIMGDIISGRHGAYAMMLSQAVMFALAVSLLYNLCVQRRIHFLLKWPVLLILAFSPLSLFLMFFIHRQTLIMVMALLSTTLTANYLFGADKRVVNKYLFLSLAIGFVGFCCKQTMLFFPIASVLAYCYRAHIHARPRQFALSLILIAYCTLFAVKTVHSFIPVAVRNNNKYDEPHYKLASYLYAFLPYAKDLTPDEARAVDQIFDVKFWQGIDRPMDIYWAIRRRNVSADTMKTFSAMMTKKILANPKPFILARISTVQRLFSPADVDFIYPAWDAETIKQVKAVYNHFSVPLKHGSYQSTGRLSPLQLKWYNGLRTYIVKGVNIPYFRGYPALALVLIVVLLSWRLRISFLLCLPFLGSLFIIVMLAPVPWPVYIRDFVSFGYIVPLFIAFEVQDLRNRKTARNPATEPNHPVEV